MRIVTLTERPSRPGPTRGAFTLIELLVVVSIIALLISILLPSLKRAREQAKQAVCLSDLKGLATAGITYSTDDRQENSVPIHPHEEIGLNFIGAYEWGGKSGRGEPLSGSEGGVSIIESRWGTQYGKGPATRPLNRFVYKTNLTNYQDDAGPNQINWVNDANVDFDLFRCPSDRGYQGIHYQAWKTSKLTSYDHFGTSFSANIFWIGAVGGADCRMRSNSPYRRPLSRVPNAANTLYFEENVGRFAWMRDPDQCPIADGIPGRVKGWHGRPWYFDVSFCDGHAGTVRIEGYRPVQLPSYPEGGSFGTYQCVIVRGDGWQKDTLPAHDIETNHPCPHAGRPSQEIPGVGVGGED